MLVPDHVLVLVSPHRKTADQIILRPQQTSESVAVRPQLYARVYYQEQPGCHTDRDRDLSHVHHVRVLYGSGPDYYSDLALSR